MDEIGIVARDFVGVVIFLDRMAAAGPFAQLADGLLVYSLENVFGRKARADYHQHQLLTAIKRISSPNHAGDAAVAVPILTYCAKVRKPARQVGFLEVCFFLITPDDVPFRITEVGIVLGTQVVFDAGRCGLSFGRLLRGRTYLCLELAVPTECDLRADGTYQK